MIKLFLKTLSILCLTAVATQVRAQSAGPYSPEQAISVFYEALRNILGFNSVASTKQWLGVSMVGSLVDAADVSQVNDLANFCPTTDPVILSYNRTRKLDRIYDKLNKSLMGPLRPPLQTVKDAQALITNSDGTPTVHYSKYSKYEDDHIKAFSAFLTAKSPAERTMANIAMQKVDKDWSLFGYRSEIDGARGVLSTNDMRFDGPMVQHRIDVLNYYLAAGLAPTDIAGAFKAPASELSPAVDKWPDAAGWLGVKYSNDEINTHYSSSTSSSRGFGGLNLGFIQVAASGGGNNGSESRVSKVYNFAYAFELKRIAIRRPWLDTEVFFEPAAWTWRQLASTTEYPLVATSADGAGKPVSSSKNIYDNVSIDCALLPQELIIARNRVLVATVSKSDYSQITSSGSVSGGGGLFGIFGGGGGKSWTTTEISSDANNVTFKVEAPGIAVIGLVSEILPKLPNPNLKDNWPADAWLPK